MRTFFRFKLYALVLTIGFVAACAEVKQGEHCAAYVECLTARDEQRGTSTDMVRFEEGGACWGSTEGAKHCERACEGGLKWLRETDPNMPSVCSPR